MRFPSVLVNGKAINFELSDLRGRSRKIWKAKKKVEKQNMWTDLISK